MLREIALGVVIGIFAIGLPLACSAPGQLTPLARCQLEALRVLPEDPQQATVYDAVDIIERVRSCHDVHDHHDAGRP